MTGEKSMTDIDALVAERKRLTEKLDRVSGQEFADTLGELDRLNSRIADHATALSDEIAVLKEREGKATIPRDIAEQVLSMGRVEWGATDKFDDAGHVAHLADSLRITREHFNFDDLPVAMHGLYLEGTETVLCHTGTSPNSGANAQALAGAWNWLVDQVEQAQ